MTEHTREPMSRGLAAFCGFVTVGLAVGVGHLVGALTKFDSSPFNAVGSDLLNVLTGLPGFAAIGRYLAGIDERLETLALTVSVGIVMIVLAVLVGLRSRTSARPMIALVVVFGVIGLACSVLAISATGVGIDPAPKTLSTVLPSLAALAAGLGSAVVLFGGRLAALLGRSGAHDVGSDGVSRRAVLAGGTGIGAVAALSGVVGQFVIGQGSNVADSRAALGRIEPDEPAPPIPAGADFAADGSPPFLTPINDFYRVDVNRVTIPQLTAEDWRLRIHGMVDNEINLDWASLTQRRLVEKTVTLTCVSNEVGGPYVSTTNFTGVMLADVLAEAGVQPGADQLFQTSIDGWTAGSPTDVAMDPAREAMIVIAMNREPLPVEHGFPVRMLIPGLYGFLSATKWVVDLELTTFEAKQGYWLQRRWGQRAPIKTMSRIDSPGTFERVGTDVALTGVAWAQPRGIERVEVRVDGGEWQEAELSAEVNTRTWRMWRLRQRLDVGGHVAEVRATDRDGYTQTDERVMPIPDGATGWHSVRFTVQ